MWIRLFPCKWRPAITKALRYACFSVAAAQIDASPNGLMKLLPGMFALIQRDEKGHYMLVAGASHTPLERDFFEQQDAICAIENHFPKRHSPELRLFYRFEPPTFEFVILIANACPKLLRWKGTL